jgi:hypothetical protein
MNAGYISKSESFHSDLIKLILRAGRSMNSLRDCEIQLTLTSQSCYRSRVNMTHPYYALKHKCYSFSVRVKSFFSAVSKLFSENLRDAD